VNKALRGGKLMSKVVAFLGSPIKDGVTTKLVEQIAEGAKAAGAEVVVYNLNEEGIKGCQGCLHCRANDGCATMDKLQPMYDDIKEADAIIGGFPIYFYDISAQSKILIDRLFPMIGSDFSPRYPGKKVVTVYAQNQPDADAFKGSIEKTNLIFNNAFGWDVVESMVSFDDSSFKALMDKASDVGKNLVG